MGSSLDPPEMGGGNRPREKLQAQRRGPGATGSEPLAPAFPGAARGDRGTQGGPAAHARRAARRVGPGGPGPPVDCPATKLETHCPSSRRAGQIAGWSWRARRTAGFRTDPFSEEPTGGWLRDLGQKGGPRIAESSFPRVLKA